MIQGSDLPALNATLNSASALLLLAGLWAVKTRRLVLHKKFMLAAIATSAAFLASYLTYHFGVRLTKHYMGDFPKVYFPILISHTLLAVTVLPLVIVTVTRAFRAQREDASLQSSETVRLFARHRAIARWTFPIWLYVSVTGVVVYVMNYQLSSR